MLTIVIDVIITSLPIMSATSTSLLECSICLEEIGEKDILTTQCGHTFHASCMFKNMVVSTKCPMCRAPLCEDPPEPPKQEVFLGLVNPSDQELENSINIVSNDSGRNQQIATDLINRIPNNITNNHSSREDLVEQFSSSVGNYVNEIVFDIFYMLRAWEYADGDQSGDEHDDNSVVVPDILSDDYELNNLEIDNNFMLNIPETSDGLLLNDIERLLEVD